MDELLKKLEEFRQGLMPNEGDRRMMGEIDIYFHIGAEQQKLAEIIKEAKEANGQITP
jgi:hypothetical protein